jgi:hypothetical protein
MDDLGGPSRKPMDALATLFFRQSWVLWEWIRLFVHKIKKLCPRERSFRVSVHWTVTFLQYSSGEVSSTLPIWDDWWSNDERSELVWSSWLKLTMPTSRQEVILVLLTALAFLSPSSKYHRSLVRVMKPSALQLSWCHLPLSLHQNLCHFSSSLHTKSFSTKETQIVKPGEPEICLNQ